ncbi:MAG TPA: metal ABC transporter ATP-binding protein [Pyrodictium sp.]|nr:metal ABC transporter ATP-binding protein [Pyrodictium sp.]
MVKLIVDRITVILGSEVVLEDVKFEVSGPGLVQVLGPNGAGKTTLFNTILGLVKPVKGRILVDGIDVTGNPRLVGRYVGYVQQFAGLDLELPITALELVASAYLLRQQKPPRLFKRKSALRKALEVLRKVGLDEHISNKPLTQLSGGQKQRAFIARALTFNPPILIMDEPFSAVDPHGRVELAKMIGELAKEKLVIISSHDPTLLLEYTSKVLLLNRRVVAFGDPEEVLREDILRKVYGSAVLVYATHVHISDSCPPRTKY